MALSRNVTKYANTVQYAIGKWIDMDHPRMETGHCIDIKQKKVPCGVCSDICPTGAIYSCRDKNWDACIDCNLCVAACPTRALRPSADAADKFLRAIDSGADKITLNCEQCEQSGYLQMYCLGAIPWEVYATIALDKQVVLDTTFCADCPEKEGKAQFAAALEQTRAFLGDTFFNERITTSNNAPIAGLSRREAFSFIREIGKSVTGNLLSEGSGTPIEGLFFRVHLGARLAEPKDDDPAVYTLETPVFNESCWACNICKNVCPEKAIRIESDKETGVYAVYHTPWRCMSCGLCKNVCADGGITAHIAFQTDDPLEDIRYPVFPAICTKCGRNFKPDGNEMCDRCVKAEERRIENERKFAEAKAKREREVAEKAAAEAAQKAAAEAAAKDAAEAGAKDVAEQTVAVEEPTNDGHVNEA